MNMRKLLQQAEEMQEKMQRELADAVVEASAGGGMVTVKMNGHRHLIEVKIDPEAVDPEDVSLLEDLVIASVNEAAAKIDEHLRGRLGNIAATMPSLF